jgi:hypothetical protein
VGNIGELKVIEACLRQGIKVFTPFGDGNVVDMILLVNNRCVKVQVKSSQSNDDGVVVFNLRSAHSTHQQNPAHYYTKDEIDAFVLYSFAYDEVYIVPITESPRNAISIRHDNPKIKLNTMNFAQDYLFEKKIWEIVK